MSAAEETGTPELRGMKVEVAPGRALRAVPAGPATSDRPLALLEAGSFGFSADWAAVQAHLADAGLRSLAYDRAGLGLSDPGPEPRDSAAIVGDLEAMLAALGEPGPYVLCGHSMAGMHVRLFAGRHRDQVRAVVLVDATTPEAMDHPMSANMVGGFAKLSRLAAWGAKRGLQRPLSGALGDAIGLSAAAKTEKQEAFSDPVHNQWASAEVDSWADDAEQARAAGPFDPDWPLAVILTGDPHQPAARHALQIAPAEASRHGLVIYVPGANHASMLGERFADQIAGVILEVERAAAKA